ncbi:MAG: hypothetical protein V1911_01665 [Candidatus Micrarchaeota archaeon]
MVNVRKAAVTDVDGIYEIYNNDGEKHHKNITMYPVMEWIIGGKVTLLIADESENLRAERLGFMVIRPKGNEASIDLFCVKKKTDTGAVRQALLEAAEKECRDRRLTVYVSKMSTTKLDFFKRNDFRVFDESKNMFGKGKHAVLMHKSIESLEDKVNAGRASNDEVLEENLKRLENLVRIKMSTDSERDELDI